MQRYAEVLEGRVCILLTPLSPGDGAGSEDLLNEGGGEKTGNERNHFAQLPVKLGETRGFTTRPIEDRRT